MNNEEDYELLERQTTQDGYLLEKYQSGKEYTLELKRHSRASTMMSKTYGQEQDADQIFEGAEDTDILEVLNPESKSSLKSGKGDAQ